MPKKWRGRLEDICSSDNVEIAYKDAKSTTKNKQSKEVVWYNDPEHRKELCQRIMNGTYVPEPSRCFRLWEPKAKKWRDIEAPTFETKLVEHMIILVFGAQIRKFFHPNSCASIEDKGIEHMRKTIKSWANLPKRTRHLYVKGDFRHFFPSIVRTVAMREYERHIGDARVIELIRLMMPHAVGLPLGNPLVQYSANLVLTAFDYECQKYTKHYARYMDDFVLLFSNKRKARKFIDHIKGWAKTNLSLAIKETGPCAIQFWSWEKKAIDIAGYRTSHAGNQKLRRQSYIKLSKLLNEDGFSVHEARSVVSLNGWVGHSDCYKLKSRTDKTICEHAIKRIIAKGAKNESTKSGHGTSCTCAAG